MQRTCPEIERCERVERRQLEAHPRCQPENGDTDKIQRVPAEVKRTTHVQISAGGRGGALGFRFTGDCGFALEASLQSWPAGEARESNFSSRGNPKSQEADARPCIIQAAGPFTLYSSRLGNL